MTFLKATFIRAIRTMAQAILAVTGASVAFSEVEWDLVLSASLAAGFFSVLTSLATGLPEAEDTKITDLP